MDETIDERQFGGALIIDTVRLRQARDTAKAVDILAVDASGNDADRPRIAWTTESTLQITAANLSYVTVLRREYGGIRIDLRFDPDDPATRADWLKWLHAPIGRPTSVRLAELRSLDGNWIAAVDELNNGMQFFPDDSVTLTSARAPADHAQVLYVGTT